MAVRTCRVGVHGRNDFKYDKRDLDLIREAKIEVVKMMSFNPPEVFRQLGNVNPDLDFIVRLYDDRINKEYYPTPADFAKRFIPTMRELQPYAVKFEVHNEPNHGQGIEGWGQEDDHARDFNAWFLEVYDRLKKACPWASLGFPGLSIPHRDLEWLEICRPAVERADWLGVHCYWQNPTYTEGNHLADSWGLRFKYYHDRFPDKFIHITEFGNSSGQSDYPVDPDKIAQETVEYYQKIFEYSYLLSACAFILSAPLKEWQIFAWRLEDGTFQPVVAAVRDMPRPLLEPAPQPQPGEEGVLETPASVTADAASKARPDPGEERGPETAAEPEEPGEIEIATRALADTPSEVDLLGFLVYAEALADFIENEETKKPLTIGIDAAWGMGKTTLMRMIEDQLTKQDQSFPTVWFNAWKYDEEESLWAALALEILSQARKQFNAWQRMRFWVKLNWKRFDWGRLLQSVLKSLAYLFGIGLLGAVVFGVALLSLGGTVQELIQKLVQYIRIVGGVGFLTALFAAGKEVYDRLTGPFDLNIAQYVREPNYKERVGFLAEFERDFKRVIEVVTEDGKWPLVVFIDDLDRCAPPKPAEIIEAINILLDAKYCVFVIGMDAHTVAGSIEAKYKDLRGYLDDADDPGGLTLGQRFLEKIVQINFRIPRADPSVMQSFIDANLDASEAEPLSRPPVERVMEAEQLLKAEQRMGKSLDEAAEAVRAAKPDLSQEVVEEARKKVFAKSFGDSEKVRRAIREATPYLGYNPRKVKRFINIFRLQSLIANRRELLQSGRIELELLAKAVIVAMRWPILVEVILADSGFLSRLQEAHKLREELRTLQAAGELDQGQERAIGASLEVFLADARIQQFIDAADLIQMLGQIQDSEIKALPQHLQLARTTLERSGSPDMSAE